MYIILAVLIFGVLIFTHELGHFLAAKIFGVKVNEFAMCMGPALWKKTVGETTYSLRLIPIGGYCAMEGEDESSSDPRAFTSAAPWKRVVILVAGAAMNFMTGLLILIIIFSTVSAYAVPKISGFMEGAEIAKTGTLQVGDELYKIDGERVYLYSDLNMLFARNQDETFDFVVKRDGKLVRLPDTTMKKQAFQVNGDTVYMYGLEFGYRENSFLGSIKNGWNGALDFARMVRLGLQDLITGAVGFREMSGPVGIVSVIADTGESSATTADAVMNITYLAAFLAVNLAIMNMLPIPALDGGRVFALVVTVLLEKVLRRKIDPKFEGYIHGAGMVLLLILIAAITLKDIWTLIVG